MRDDGQGGSGGSGEQWAETGWILKEESTAFAHGLDIEMGILGSPQALTVAVCHFGAF